MAQKNFTIEGHKEIIAAFKDSQRLVQSVGKFHMRHFGNFAVEEVKRRILNAGSVDTNELIQGIHHTTKNKHEGVITIIKPSKKADKYAAAMEYGTKPHFPPISALQGWADRHGIPVWAVARKIARDGTEPRWMWRDAFGTIKKGVPKLANEIADDIIRKI